ncbi:MAG: BREX-2 system adenine-specific DNA-methyltransferase PglX [Planctomycetaceae bacterium]
MWNWCSGPEFGFYWVDINPFAIAIARFRLLLVAMQACGIKQLKDAPAFTMNLACGDSLYHGRQRQQTLGDWTDESHYFRTEDAENLRRILQEGTFHTVVANPPYITPKDRAANKVYRKLYPKTCHMKYSLAMPFMDRIFQLAAHGGTDTGAAGFTGQITANSFMKRAFGKKFVEELFPILDVTHVIDTSGAFIPGHGTPTVILFGRNRKPLQSSIRTALGIRGEPETPDEPASGLVWQSIISHLDHAGKQTEFISIDDSERTKFCKHPWSIGGGGAAELKERIDKASVSALNSIASAIGVLGMTNADDIMFAPLAAFRRRRVEERARRTVLLGDDIRDWTVPRNMASLFPYDSDGLLSITALPGLLLWLWPAKTTLGNRATFSRQTYFIEGRPWWEWHQITASRIDKQNTLVFAFLAPHNHFVTPQLGEIYNHSSPVVQLPETASQDEYFALLGLMNSSLACFWLKQVSHQKQMTGGDGIRLDSRAKVPYEYSGTQVAKFPLPLAWDNSKYRSDLAKHAQEMLRLAEQFESLSARAAISTEPIEASSIRKRWEQNSESRNAIRARQFLLQEEIDYICYRMYDIVDDSLLSRSLPDFALGQGDRPYCIVEGKNEDGFTVPSRVPSEWPEVVSTLWTARVSAIQGDRDLGLLESAMTKRRWIGRQGLFNHQRVDDEFGEDGKLWLVERLESYFDLDGRMNDEGTVTAKIDISLTSVAKLADIARQDEQFMEVAEVYRDDPAFDVQRLVAELVQGEHVPLLPVLRYKPDGLRNRAEWEKTWELQRLEDKLRAGQAVKLADYELTDKQREQIAKWQTDTPEAQRSNDRGLDAILSIPVPPKYKRGDFISTGGARYWSLRGKLDVPKERWVSFPHCEGPDGTLMIAWAGYNHLQLAQAISAYYVDVQERLGGRDDPRLVPLLAGVIELMPWLKQWHHDIDPEYNQRMDEVYEGFAIEEAKGLGMTEDEVKAWAPKKNR